MKNTFLCPHCQSVLNPNVKILLAAKYGGKRGMVLLSPQPGNYRFITDKNFVEALAPGAEVEFYCPVCSKDLTAPSSKQLVEVQLLTPGHEPRRVQFSRAHEVHATFVISGESVTSYGDDADDLDNINFFGV